MHLLVPPVSAGLIQEEKYKNLPRDRWAKWREKQRERQRIKVNLANPRQNQRPPPPLKHWGNRTKPFQSATIIDAQAATLFATKMLTAH